MNKIKLSIKQKDYEGSHNKYFKNVMADKNDFENIFKSYNYSLITWKIDVEKKDKEYNRRRKIENFESASGFVVDIDENLSITSAQKKLKDEKLNHIIITSKSHWQKKKESPAQDRYHILLLFKRDITDRKKYDKVVNYMKNVFPQMDDNCNDLGRFIFASSENAEYYCWFDGANLNPDDIPDKDFLNTPIAEEKNIFEFDNEMEVRLGSGKVVKATQITTKQPCYCVRPEHNDNNPSAIISLNKEEDKWVIHCTGCKWTGWSKLSKTEYELNKQMQNFYYLGKDIYEMGIAEDKFFLTKNSEKNFFYTIGAEKKDNQETALKNLIKNRRLRTLTRVDYVGNPEVNESYYSVSPADGLIKVNILLYSPV